MLFGFDF